MENILFELTPPLEYQLQRTRVFPSEQSLLWFMRLHKAALAKVGAVRKLRGRLMVLPRAFDAFVLAESERGMNASLEPSQPITTAAVDEEAM